MLSPEICFPFQPFDHLHSLQIVQTVRFLTNLNNLEKQQKKIAIFTEQSAFMWQSTGKAVARSFYVWQS